jgi:hypothetical protein
VVQVALSVAAVPIVAEVAWETMRPAILGPGFDAREFLTARLALELHGSSDAVAARFRAVRTELIRQLESEPGVTAVTMSETVPFEERDVLIEVDGAGTGGSVHAPSLVTSSLSLTSVHSLGRLCHRRQRRRSINSLPDTEIAFKPLDLHCFFLASASEALYGSSY